MYLLNLSLCSLVGVQCTLSTTSVGHRQFPKVRVYSQTHCEKCDLSEMSDLFRFKTFQAIEHFRLLRKVLEGHIFAVYLDMKKCSLKVCQLSSINEVRTSS